MDLCEFIGMTPQVMFPIDDDYGLPKPFAVIYDGDLTAIAWDDGTVTRTHRMDGDERDMLFGTLACIIRKVTNNRGHAVDDYEPMLRFIASCIEEEDDVDYLIDDCLLFLDVLSVLRDSKDKWLSQLGKGETKPVEASKPMAPKVVTPTEEKLAEYERTRQTVRNLVDMGEL